MARMRTNRRHWEPPGLLTGIAKTGGTISNRCSSVSGCGAMHSTQRAQQQTQTPAAAQVKEAEAVADYIKSVHARWFACLPDAEAALAAYEGQGRRGRRPRPWRYHAVRYRSVADTRRT